MRPRSSMTICAPVTWAASKVFLTKDPTSAVVIVVPSGRRLRRTLVAFQQSNQKRVTDNKAAKPNKVFTMLKIDRPSRLVAFSHLDKTLIGR